MKTCFVCFSKGTLIPEGAIPALKKALTEGDPGQLPIRSGGIMQKQNLPHNMNQNMSPSINNFGQYFQSKHFSFFKEICFLFAMSDTLLCG